MLRSATRLPRRQLLEDFAALMVTLLVAVVVAGRLAVLVAPNAFTPVISASWFTSFSGAGEPGDSRLLRPEWASRPIAVELWYWFRTVIEWLCLHLFGIAASVRLRTFIYGAWFLGWFLIIGKLAVYLVSRHAAPAHADYSAPRRAAGDTALRPFLLATLATCVLAYAYYFFAAYLTAAPYDLVAVALNLASFAIAFALLDSRSYPLLALAIAWVMLGVFVKETVLLGFLGVAVVLLVSRVPRRLPVALPLVAAVVTAKLLQTIYGNWVVRAEEYNSLQSTGELLRGTITMFRVNAGYLFKTWPGPEIGQPLIYLGPLLVALTPLYRSGLPRAKHDALRVGVALFLLAIFAGASTLETRVLLEFVVPIVLLPLLAWNARGAPVHMSQRRQLVADSDAASRHSG